MYIFLYRRYSADYSLCAVQEETNHSHCSKPFQEDKRVERAFPNPATSVRAKAKRFVPYLSIEKSSHLPKRHNQSPQSIFPDPTLGYLYYEPHHVIEANLPRCARVKYQIAQPSNGWPRVMIRPVGDRDQSCCV